MPYKRQPTKDDIRKLVHTPAEIARDYIAWAKKRQDHPGIKWGIETIDQKTIPMHPGDLICLLARPGHGKSSLLAYMARTQSARLQANGITDRCVVYCTWENTVEELANFLLADDSYSVTDVAFGRVPLEEVERASKRLVQQNIFIIGRGIGKLDTIGLRMTPELVWHIIETMHEDFGVRPEIMLFDYLQLIPSENYRERKEQIAEAPIRIKELAQTVGAPAVCAVQASRDVDKYKEKIPTISDAQWSSAIEQTADKAFGLWRPILTEGPTSMPVVGRDGVERHIQVTDTLLIMRKLKERYNVGRFTVPMYFAPQYLRLAELEMQSIDGYTDEYT